VVILFSRSIWYLYESGSLALSTHDEPLRLTQRAAAGSLANKPIWWLSEAALPCLKISRIDDCKINSDHFHCRCNSSMSNGIIHYSLFKHYYVLDMCHEGRTVGSPAAAIGTERLKRRLPNNGASAFARIIVLELRPCFLCRLFCLRNICPHLPEDANYQLTPILIQPDLGPKLLPA